MNEETETELTVNVEPDPPGKRPAKKKPVAKKKAAPAKKSKGTVPVKKAGKKTKSVPSPKAPSSGKKPGKSPKATAGKKPVGRKTAKSRTVATPKTKTTTPKPTSGEAGKRHYSRNVPEGVIVADLTPSKLYGIQRMEQESKKNYGWYVRVGAPGAVTRQFFADKKHGGKNKALAAATAKRDELYKALPDWYKVRGSKTQKRRKAA